MTLDELSQLSDKFHQGQLWGDGSVFINVHGKYQSIYSFDLPVDLAAYFAETHRTLPHLLAAARCLAYALRIDAFKEKDAQPAKWARAILESLERNESIPINRNSALEAK